jgi:hypothetical protein
MLLTYQVEPSCCCVCESTSFEHQQPPGPTSSRSPPASLTACLTCSPQCRTNHLEGLVGLAAPSWTRRHTRAQYQLKGRGCIADQPGTTPPAPMQQATQANTIRCRSCCCAHPQPVSRRKPHPTPAGLHYIAIYVLSGWTCIGRFVTV